MTHGRTCTCVAEHYWHNAERATNADGHGCVPFTDLNSVMCRATTSDRVAANGCVGAVWWGLVISLCVHFGWHALSQQTGDIILPKLHTMRSLTLQPLFTRVPLRRMQDTCECRCLNEQTRVTSYHCTHTRRITHLTAGHNASSPRVHNTSFIRNKCRKKSIAITPQRIVRFR